MDKKMEYKTLTEELEIEKDFLFGLGVEEREINFILKGKLLKED